MSQRSKASMKAYKDVQLPTGSTPIRSSAHRAVLEDLIDSIPFLDGTHTPPELVQTNVASADYVGAGIKVAYSSDTDRSMYRFLVYAGAAAVGNTDLNGSILCPEDSVVTFTIHAQGVASGGSAGISAVKTASFRRDGSSDIVQIGTTTTLHSVEDSGDTPTITLTTNGTGPKNIRVSYDSNGATVYTWTIFADVSVTKV